MTFFTIFGGIMEVRCPFMKRKRIQERIQLKETSSLPKQEEAARYNWTKLTYNYRVVHTFT